MVGNNYESSVFRTTEGESREPRPLSASSRPQLSRPGGPPRCSSVVLPKARLACWGFDKGNRPVGPPPLPPSSDSTSTSTSTSNSSTSARLRTEPSRTRSAAVNSRDDADCCSSLATPLATHHRQTPLGTTVPGEGQFARRVQADGRTPTPPAPRPHLRTSTTFAALHPLPLASI